MILITGGTGLVGAQIMLNLLQQGSKVRALKRSSSNLDVVKRIFRNDPVLLDRIEWKEGDVTDVYSVMEALQDVKQVYHSAAVISFRSSDKQEMMRVNSGGTANLVNCSMESGVERFCHISSVAAIGRVEEGKMIDENSLWKTSGSNTNYAISKYSAEREVWRAIEEGLDAVIVNPSVILGPGNWNAGSSKLFRQVWKGLRFYTEGMTGFVDVRDVAACCILLMEKKVSGKRFILNSENIFYRDLLSHIAEGFNKRPPAFRAKRWMSELAWRFEAIRSVLSDSAPLITRETSRSSRKKWTYSNDRIRQELGYEFIPVNKSVGETCEQYLEAIRLGELGNT